MIYLKKNIDDEFDLRNIYEYFKNDVNWIVKKLDVYILKKIELLKIQNYEFNTHGVY